MTVHCLELRSTENWQDVRYRAYTTSARKAEAFRSIPKIKFTDSAHGIVPTVSEGRQGAVITILASHVAEHMPKTTARNDRRALIAAAPELLETIIECRKHINLIIEDGAPTDWRMWRDDLDALIAKATDPK